MQDRPEMNPLTSSMLSGYRYDEASRALTVEFKNGGSYQYDDVGPDKVEQMLKADSPGGFFSTRIRDVHPSRKLGS